MILLLIAQFAMADIPPPAGYVEACALDKYPEGCVMCSAYHGGREECESLEESGYTQECKTRGASVWSELMCPGPNATKPAGLKPPAEPAPPTEPTPPAEPTKPTAEPGATSQPIKASGGDTSSKCSTVSPAAAFPLLLVGLLGLRRRRE